MAGAAFGDIGTKVVAGTTTTAIAYPANVGIGDLLLAVRCLWDNLSTATDEAGWTNTADLLGGLVGTNTTDSHQTRIRVDRLESAAVLSGSVTFDNGGTVGGSAGIMLRYSGASWSVAAVTGDDATHGADRSVTASSTLDLAVDDMVVLAVAVDTDTAQTITAPTLTASGITFGTVTRRTSGGGATTGNDGNVEVFDAVVTAGSGTVAPTFAFTSATSQCGPIAFVRLRATGATQARIGGEQVRIGAPASYVSDARLGGVQIRVGVPFPSPAAPPAGTGLATKVWTGTEWYPS